MSLLVEFQEFRGISNERFMMELDKLLLISLQKLKDSTDMRRRVLLYPIFDKLIKYRTFDEAEDDQMEVDENVTF